MQGRDQKSMQTKNSMGLREALDLIKSIALTTTPRDRVMEEGFLGGLLSPSLRITKEIISRGPQVLDMEYREPY